MQLVFVEDNVHLLGVDAILGHVLLHGLEVGIADYKKKHTD
jgi:hypothetical protein